MTNVIGMNVIFNAVTTNFRELTPSREEAYCCGGGSGLVALTEAQDIRMLAGKPKVEQMKRSQAQIVVAACENCRLQLGDLSGFYGLGIGVTALVDLVVKAMRYTTICFCHPHAFVPWW